MRLIDADALLKALNDYGLSYRADINGMIMQAPTIAPSGDLISRADAIEAVDRIKSTDNWQGAVIALIGSLPSADAVEVVRCKDCRHHGMRDCPVWEDVITEDYMWCYKGERREP